VLYREPATEMVARFVGRGMVVPVEGIGRDGPRSVVDLWGTRIAVRGEGRAGMRHKLCLRVEDLAISPASTVGSSTGEILGRVVAIAYQGATSLLTIQPEAAGAPPLRLQQAGEPPAVGAAVAVVVQDGWIIPERCIA
jgi:iron(III) transport system ATP-binding protein